MSKSLQDVIESDSEGDAVIIRVKDGVKTRKVAQPAMHLDEEEIAPWYQNNFKENH